MVNIPVTLAQEVGDPKIINEHNFNQSMRPNITRIFAISPYGNINKVKYEGFYAILEIENGKIYQIIYPDWIDPTITRLSISALEDINGRIDLGEFKFENIEQIIVPAIIEWINFDDGKISINEAMERIVPNIGYTQNTYVLFPHLIRTGDPIIN